MISDANLRRASCHDGSHQQLLPTRFAIHYLQCLICDASNCSVATCAQHRNSRPTSLLMGRWMVYNERGGTVGRLNDE